MSLAALLTLVTLLSGCGLFSTSYESAAQLDQNGRSSEAITAYLAYLKNHSGSTLMPKIYYRIAKNYETQSEYDSAIIWYQKILAECPQTDEEVHALLDLAGLYGEKLKNASKAMEYNQRAFDRYMDNIQIKNAIQSLIEAQYLTATALYSQKSYKNVTGALDGIYKTYPVGFISLDTRAKIDSLADRSRRADEISKAGVDLVVLRDEIPFNKSFESDFPPVVDEGEDKVIASPDGGYLAARKKAPNGLFYLYAAKVPAKGDQVVFKLIKQTFGADKPSWSPNGAELVYWRTVGGLRKLEKTNILTMTTQTLFYTKSQSIGIHPAYHPAGNKVAYVYAGRICLINTGDSLYKQLLKTKQKLDYTADLAWSTDGTMIRCGQVDPKDKTKKIFDELLVLDIAIPGTP